MEDTEEVANVKIVSKNNQAKTPESASRVLIKMENNTNDISYQTKTKNATQSIKEEDVIKNIMSKKSTQKSEIRAHTQYDEVTGELVGGAHPCERECREGEEPMICYYHFNLEWYQTMSKACYNCPYNEADCNRIDCIPADGMNRALNVVNRKMPGPALEVSIFYHLHFLMIR